MKKEKILIIMITSIILLIVFTSCQSSEPSTVSEETEDKLFAEPIWIWRKKEEKLYE